MALASGSPFRDLISSFINAEVDYVPLLDIPLASQGLSSAVFRGHFPATDCAHCLLASFRLRPPGGPRPDGDCLQKDAPTAARPGSVLKTRPACHRTCTWTLGYQEKGVSPVLVRVRIYLPSPVLPPVVSFAFLVLGAFFCSQIISD